jgi:hypothetical protein
MLNLTNQTGTSYDCGLLNRRKEALAPHSPVMDLVVLPVRTSPAPDIVALGAVGAESIGS